MFCKLNLHIGTVVLGVVLPLQITSHARYVAIVVMYLHTKFHPLNYTKLLVIIIGPKAEETFHATTRHKLTFYKSELSFLFLECLSQTSINTTLTTRCG